MLNMKTFEIPETFYNIMCTLFNKDLNPTVKTLLAFIGAVL